MITPRIIRWLPFAVLLFLFLVGCTNQANVLFQDDFSSKTNNWPQTQDAERIMDYYQDGYRIKVDRAEWVFWANPGINLTDVKIDVDVTKIGGPEVNEFGVICRYVDEDNFYFLTTTSDGYYSVNKLEGGGFTFLDSGETTTVKGGNVRNHLTAECNGATLRFWVNGTLLVDVQDNTFPAGDVGLFAGTASTPGTDVLFDNFIVTKP